MVTYLDLLNEARGLQSSSPLTAIGAAGDSSDAIRGIQAINLTVRKILKSSVNFDFSSRIETVTTLGGNNVLSSPSSPNLWNPQIISAIKLRTSSEYTNLKQVGTQRAKELEFALTTQGKPIYFYVHKGEVKVIPTPDQNYNLDVFYQIDLLRITGSNITDEVIFPADFHDAIVFGTHAYLRKAIGDPEWQAILDGDYTEALDKAIIRNQFGLKQQGKRLFRMRGNRDRGL
ncbi:MAG: hypothetical protein HRT47_01450 [Candidatus Caenarcaniphilales bacterium]|nr:hypothetical protein [Candidatus Caenarcaniphilales bacterium]